MALGTICCDEGVVVSIEQHMQPLVQFMLQELQNDSVLIK